MSYMTLSSQEKHLFYSFILSRTSDNTRLLLKILGGDECMDRPPPQTLGVRPPVNPRFPPLPTQYPFWERERLEPSSSGRQEASYKYPEWMNILRHVKEDIIIFDDSAFGN